MNRKSASELVPLWISLLISAQFTHTVQISSELTVDISEDCQHNYTTSVQLSYGSGAADARTLLLRPLNSVASCSVFVVSPDNRNCKDKCVVVVVIELVNLQWFNATCSTKRNGIYLKSKEELFANVCEDILTHNSMNRHHVKAYLVHGKTFSVDINFEEFSGTIRMTVTGARYLGNHGNCTEKELYCGLHGQIFCVDKFLECDGNWNCGTPDMYDEYCESLYAQDNVTFMVLYAIILVAVLMFFFVQLLRKCVPTVADHFFIFNEDEDYNFVLTSQSLPPLRVVKISNEEQRTTRATDNRIY